MEFRSGHCMCKIWRLLMSVHLKQLKMGKGQNDEGGFSAEQIQMYKDCFKLMDINNGRVSSQLPELSLPEEISSTVNTVSTTVGGINKNLYSYYNCGVVTTLKGIQQLPDTVAEYSAMAVDKMKEAMK